MQMDFMQNRHILPVRPPCVLRRDVCSQREMAPRKQPGRPEEKSGRKAVPLQVHTMSTNCQENGGGVQFLRIFSKSSEIVH